MAALAAGADMVNDISGLTFDHNMASLIAEHGYDKALKWAKGFVKNLAKRPQGNDRSQIMAVANGEADIAIANTYYYGLMLSGTAGADQLNAAKKVKMLFPNQDIEALMSISVVLGY